MKILLQRTYDMWVDPPERSDVLSRINLCNHRAIRSFRIPISDRRGDKIHIYSIGEAGQLYVWNIHHMLHTWQNLRTYRTIFHNIRPDTPVLCSGQILIKLYDMLRYLLTLNRRNILVQKDDIPVGRNLSFYRIQLLIEIRTNINIIFWDKCASLSSPGISDMLKKITMR